MHKFGEIFDRKMAEEVCRKLRFRGIEATFGPSVEESGKLELFVEREEQVPVAFDFLRVNLGMNRVFEPPKEWEKMRSVSLGQITKTLIIISVGLFILGKIDSTKEFLDYFFISREPSKPFNEILKGELWRLWTPIFLHFGFMHIIFNMLWLKDLGSMIEHFKGAKVFSLLVFFTALIPNILQYMIMGPFFGGMSGVVYGLLGFLWMHKTFDPETQYSLPKSDVVLMIVWFFLCLTGAMGPIANIAHGAGLGVGMLAGMLAGSLSFGKFNWSKAIQFTALSIFFVFGTVIIEVLKGATRFGG